MIARQRDMSHPEVSWGKHNLGHTVFPAKAGIQKGAGWTVYLHLEETAPRQLASVIPEPTRYV